MKILEKLSEIHAAHHEPVLIGKSENIYYKDIAAANEVDLSEISAGDVVALIGDFDPQSLKTMLQLIERDTIIVPLTDETRSEHDYFFETAKVDFTIEGSQVTRIRDAPAKNLILDKLRSLHQPGLVVFSSGTTGRPKAALHNFKDLLGRYDVPRHALRTINFLFFDHIGGVNTLFHTLFNRGVVVSPSERTPATILKEIEDYSVELLPTTPTFLRMMLMSGLLENGPPSSLKLITYGAERMDQITLEQLVDLCPNVDFRQTYGTSEIGILKIVSRSKNSLWMKIVGKGIETKIVDGVLKIRSSGNRMMAYIDAPSPFNEDGWYDTNDLVEVDGEWFRIIGRTNQVINVGGIKIMPEEIERIALQHGSVLHASARGVKNPITGEYIELICQLREGAHLNKKELKDYYSTKLTPNLIPHRIKFQNIGISHRFKQQ